jgi:hypothetical protein
MKPYGSRELLGAIDAIEERRAGKAPGRLPSGFRLFTRTGSSGPVAPDGQAL